MKEFKEEGMKEGLPVVKRNDKQILEQLAKDMQNEIVENKSLEKKDKYGAENSIQVIKRLKNELDELKKLPVAEDLNKQIENKKDEINKFIESN